jgi:DNA-binding IclR family transcriptional regulator
MRSSLNISAVGILNVLEVFGRKSQPLSLAQLAAETRRPKSTLHRMLATLVHAGFVEQDRETSKYRLTLKMWSLGMSALAGLDMLKVARPHLEALMTASDETVHLAVLEASGQIVYLTKVESPRSIRVQTQIGKHSPAYCTATGRALLAFQPETREQVLSQPLQTLTPETVTDPNRLRQILETVAVKGYAVTKGENHSEMGGIAAPIRDHTGAVVASCGIAIPIFRMRRELVERGVPLVVKYANAISTDLGYRATSDRKVV